MSQPSRRVKIIHAMGLHARPTGLFIDHACTFECEIRVAFAGGEAVAGEQMAEAPPASHEQMTYLYRHLEQVMLATGFLNPANPRHLMRRLKRLFNRARPDENEVNILRGLLTSMEEHLGESKKHARR